jgi:hypothetical protein
MILFSVERYPLLDMADFVSCLQLCVQPRAAALQVSRLWHSVFTVELPAWYDASLVGINQIQAQEHPEPGAALTDHLRTSAAVDDLVMVNSAQRYDVPSLVDRVAIAFDEHTRICYTDNQR